MAKTEGKLCKTCENGIMLNKLRDEIHQNAIKHGWRDEERSFGDIIALCHSDIDFRYDSLCLAEYKSQVGGQEVRRTKLPLVKMVHYFDKNKAWRCGQVVQETKTSVIVYTAYREKEVVPRNKIIREEFVTPDRAYLRPRRK